MKDVPTSKRSHSRLVTKLVLLTLAMFGFGFALAPLYNLFCEVTGLNGKVGRAEGQKVAALKVVKERSVTVEFTGHASTGLPWEFHSLQKRVVVHPGEPTVVRYYVRNRAHEAIVGQAIPSVSPGRAAMHFKKIECFCFTQQKLAPGEEREMPVQFVINPELAPEVEVITLSYTFFNTDKTLAQKYGGEGAPIPEHDHAHSHSPVSGGDKG